MVRIHYTLYIIEVVTVWREKKREVWMGKPALAGALLLV